MLGPTTQCDDNVHGATTQLRGYYGRHDGAIARRDDAILKESADCNTRLYSDHVHVATTKMRNDVLEPTAQFCDKVHDTTTQDCDSVHGATNKFWTTCMARQRKFTTVSSAWRRNVTTV